MSFTTPIIFCRSSNPYGEVFWGDVKESGCYLLISMDYGMAIKLPTSNCMDQNILEFTGSIFGKIPGMRKVFVVKPRKTSSINQWRWGYKLWYILNRPIQGFYFVTLKSDNQIKNGMMALQSNWPINEGVYFTLTCARNSIASYSSSQKRHRAMWSTK